MHSFTASLDYVPERFGFGKNKETRKGNAGRAVDVADSGADVGTCGGSEHGPQGKGFKPGGNAAPLDAERFGTRVKIRVRPPK